MDPTLSNDLVRILIRLRAANAETIDDCLFNVSHHETDLVTIPLLHSYKMFTNNI